MAPPFNALGPSFAKRVVAVPPCTETFFNTPGDVGAPKKS
jgi:hypothetical protein